MNIYIYICENYINMLLNEYTINLKRNKFWYILVWREYKTDRIKEMQIITV
jgi:hypothetical protein